MGTPLLSKNRKIPSPKFFNIFIFPPKVVYHIYSN